MIRQFISDHVFADYIEDPLLRSAVERQFQIVGEALNKLSRADPTVAAEVPDLERLVAYRNILVHGYASVDDRIVWDLATTRVTCLIQTLDGLLRDLEDSEDG